MQNSLPSYAHILFGLRPDSTKIFWKVLVIVILFLSFERITYAYLLSISITNDKYQNPLLNLLINQKFARPAS